MAMMQWCSAIARRMMLPPHRMSMSTASSTSSSSSSSSSSTGMPIVCGRGDKRTKKGKRFKGTYGNSRPTKKHAIQRFKDKVEVPRSTPWPLPFKLI